MKNYDLKQSGAEVQELLDQVPVNKKEIERLKQLYAGLSKTDVEIVAALPEVGVANTIYRVTGSDGYADYMFNADDLSTAVLLATYGNGIDEEPVAGSENLVKSGGVLESLDNKTNSLYHVNVRMNSQINLTTKECIFSDLYDVTEMIYLAEDTSLVDVIGYDAFRYIWYMEDGSIIQNIENYIGRGNAVAVRILFEHRDSYDGLSIRQDGGYHTVEQASFHYSLKPKIKYGKYYFFSSGQVEILDGATSCYIEPIDLSIYFGKFIVLKLSNYSTNTSGRLSAIITEDYKTNNALRENNPSLVEGSVAYFRFPITARYFVASWMNLHVLEDIYIENSPYTNKAIEELYLSGKRLNEELLITKNIESPHSKTGKYYNVLSEFVVLTDDEGSKYIEPIDVEDYKGQEVEVVVKNYGITTSSRGIALVDENMLRISYAIEANPTIVEGANAIFRLPVLGKYLLVSCPIGFDIASIRFLKAEGIAEKVDNIGDIIKHTGQLGDMKSRTIIPLFDNGYVNVADGTWQENSVLRTSHYIPVCYGENIIFNAGMAAGRYVISYWDSLKRLIPSHSIEGDGSNHVYNVTIPEGVAYIRVSHDSRSSSDWNLYVNGLINAIEHSIPAARSMNNQWLRLKKSAPKKPVIAFEMDMNNYSAANTKEYIDTLEEYGVKGSTFYVFPFGYSDSAAFTKAYRTIHTRGHEIALHSLPTDGTGSTTSAPQASEEEFRSFMKEYFDWFGQYGWYPTGWVTTQGNLYAGLLPLVKEYMNYAHTLPNGDWTQESAVDYVHKREDDRYTFRRFGYEMGPTGTAEQEANLIDNIKAGIDKAIAENGMLILYCHSYNDDSAPYTLRESTLIPILEYIKPYIEQYRIVTGNIQDVVEYFFE